MYTVLLVAGILLAIYLIIALFLYWKMGGFEKYGNEWAGIAWAWPALLFSGLKERFRNLRHR